MAPGVPSERFVFFGLFHFYPPENPTDLKYNTGKLFFIFRLPDYNK
jgi:hypothetical protein